MWNVNIVRILYLQIAFHLPALSSVLAREKFLLFGKGMRRRKNPTFYCIWVEWRNNKNSKMSKNISFRYNKMQLYGPDDPDTVVRKRWMSEECTIRTLLHVWNARFHFERLFSFHILWSKIVGRSSDRWDALPEHQKNGWINGEKKKTERFFLYFMNKNCFICLFEGGIINIPYMYTQWPRHNVITI